MNQDDYRRGYRDGWAAALRSAADEIEETYHAAMQPHTVRTADVVTHLRQRADHSRRGKGNG